MNIRPLERDFRALHTLQLLGAGGSALDALTPKTGYELLQAVRRTRAQLGKSASPGAYYHLLKKMIKVKLVEVIENSPSAQSSLNPGQAALRISMEGVQLYADNVEDAIAEQIPHPRKDLLYGLLIISSEGNRASILAPWVRRIKAELIKDNQSLRQDLGDRAFHSDGSLALESWRLAEGEALFAFMQKIERQLIG